MTSGYHNHLSVVHCMPWWYLFRRAPTSSVIPENIITALFSCHRQSLKILAPLSLASVLLDSWPCAWLSYPSYISSWWHLSPSERDAGAPIRKGGLACFGASYNAPCKCGVGAHPLVKGLRQLFKLPAGRANWSGCFKRPDCLQFQSISIPPFASSGEVVRAPTVLGMFHE